MPTKSLAQLESLVGTKFQVVERFPLERGKIAEFATAILEDDPVYLDSSSETARERGFEDVPTPVTFTMASSFFQDRQPTEGRPDIGFDQERVVHGEQSFEFERQPVAGDTLSAEGELVDVYQKERSDGTMTFAEWETTYRDAHGDVVVREQSTVIELPSSEGQNDD